ncbi:hypothetical protein HY988_04130 [Candidatus Micrarchaeota archaeon]|nr:hypothetical protein [Candidatus Micrarchaeota archaeon]
MFEIPTKETGIIAVVILVGLMVVSGINLKPKFENPGFVFNEAPLYKNTQLQIRPGETYVYSYVVQNKTVNATYEIFEGSGCTGIRLIENIDQPGICVGKDGLDSTRSNISFKDQSIILYKPWMLALTDGWKWNVTAYTAFNDSQVYFATTNFRVLRRDNYLGREVFVVEEKNTINSVQYEWVDVEKRILLRIIGEGFEIDLTKGVEFAE